MKEMSRLGICEPRLEVPFFDLSFSALCEQMQGVQPVTWAQSSYHGHQCNLSAVATSLIANISSTVGGLNLSELKHR